MRKKVTTDVITEDMSMYSHNNVHKVIGKEIEYPYTISFNRPGNFLVKIEDHEVECMKITPDDAEKQEKIDNAAKIISERMSFMFPELFDSEFLSALSVAVEVLKGEY